FIHISLFKTRTSVTDFFTRRIGPADQRRGNGWLVRYDKKTCHSLQRVDNPDDVFSFSKFLYGFKKDFTRLNRLTVLCEEMSQICAVPQIIIRNSQIGVVLNTLFKKCTGFFKIAPRRFYTSQGQKEVHRALVV